MALHGKYKAKVEAALSMDGPGYIVIPLFDHDDDDTELPLRDVGG